MITLAASLPAISLTPDSAWVSEIPFLRNLAGGVYAAGLVIAVIALVITVVVVGLVKSGLVRADLDPRHVAGVVISAIALGAVSGLVGLSLGKFSIPEFGSGLKAPRPPLIEVEEPNPDCPPFAFPGLIC